MDKSNNNFLSYGMLHVSLLVNQNPVYLYVYKHESNAIKSHIGEVKITSGYVLEQQSRSNVGSSFHTKDQY